MFPDDLIEEDWHALAAIKLGEAGFEPARIKELMDVAVSLAKGVASLEERNRIRVGGEGGDHGESSQPRRPAR